MLVLLVCLMWTIALVGFLVKSAIGSEIIKNLRKRSVISKICALVSFIGFIAWGGVKPDSNMQSTTTSQIPSMNDTFITMSNGGIVSDGTNIISSTTSFSEEELATRLIFLDVGTNTTFVSYNDDAIVNDKWVTTGAAYDYMYIKPEYWSFPLAGETNKSVFVSTTGNISFGRPVARTGCFSNYHAVISPFRAVQGVLPEYKWDLLGTNTQSRFWYTETDYWSLILTWENFLLGRMTNSLVSYQAELFYNGEIEFRYDFSRLNENLTNVVVGFQQGAVSNYFTNLSFNIGGVSVKRLPPSLANNHDEDSDGISDADEVFVYGTEPTLSDSDFDGKDDATEILDGSNPIDPDENCDGIRDYLSTDPIEFIATSPEESNGVFVFRSNMPEGMQATLIINSEIIPITEAFYDVFFNLDEGVLYNYQVYLPQGCLGDIYFEDTDTFLYKSMRNMQLNLQNEERLNEESRVVSQKSTVLYTLKENKINNFSLLYSGYLAKTKLSLLNESEYDFYPLDNPCLHDSNDVLYRLNVEPSLFLNDAEIEVNNLTKLSPNKYRLDVDSTKGNESIGLLKFFYPTKNSSIDFVVKAHLCTPEGQYCYGCGVYHHGGECGVHTTDCLVPTDFNAECTCDYFFAELNLYDSNQNGVEDRYDTDDEILIKNTKSLQLIDTTDVCCCPLLSDSTYLKNVSADSNINVKEVFTNSIDFVAESKSSSKGYSDVTYDVYRIKNNEEPDEKVKTITKKLFVAGADILFDYNDDGVIDVLDKQLQWDFITGKCLMYGSENHRLMKLKYESPINGELYSIGANIYNSSISSEFFEQPLLINSGEITENLYFTAPLTNSNINFTINGTYFQKTHQIKIIDTTLTNMCVKVGDIIKLPYHGSGTINHISFIDKKTNLCVAGMDSDGEFTITLNPGEYNMEVCFEGVYKEGFTPYKNECTIIVSNIDLKNGKYGIKCGSETALEVQLYNTEPFYSDLVWRISPELDGGARLSTDGVISNIAVTALSGNKIFIHGGIVTNKYNITAWRNDKQITPSTNIVVNVFPYEIDVPDQIVSSYSIKSAPIGVSTISEHTNHRWKLEKSYNGSGGNTELAKIGVTTNSINKSSLNSSKVYFKSSKAGEKYNLTATHEIYTNVADTVEFRTCDINFEPICTQVYDGKVVNPSGISLNHFGYFYLEIEPFSFVNENISWSSKNKKIIFDMINTINNGRIIKVFAKFEGHDYIQAQIPDYYEIQPEMFVQCIKELKTIKLQPIVIKNSSGYYPSNVNGNEYFNQQYAQFTNSLTYLNLIYAQVGVNFEVESPIEYQSDTSHNDLFYNVSLNNLNNDYIVNDFKFIHPTFNGVKIFLVNEIEQKPNSINITRALTILNGDGAPIGIILPHNFKPKELAHEIGHCCLLKDIYCDILKFEPLDYNSCLDLSITSNYNYYNSFFTYYDAINSLLMCGKPDSIENEPILEIPIRYIYGLKTIDTLEKGHIPTGLLTMERNPTTYGEENEAF